MIKEDAQIKLDMLSKEEIDILTRRLKVLLDKISDVKNYISDKRRDSLEELINFAILIVIKKNEYKDAFKIRIDIWEQLYVFFCNGGKEDDVEGLLKQIINENNINKDVLDKELTK